MAISGYRSGFLDGVGGMIRAAILLVLAFSANAGRIEAQDTTYVPATELPNGKQIVAVYFGASWCGPCQTPAMKAAIQKMKVLVGNQAKQSNASFSAIVVALDHNMNDGLRFITPLGAFDEYIISFSIAGSAPQRFMWTDATAETAHAPEVFVIERTVTVEPHKSVAFSPDHVLRIVGGDSIPMWVAAGAPIR